MRVTLFNKSYLCIFTEIIKQCCPNFCGLFYGIIGNDWKIARANYHILPINRCGNYLQFSQYNIYNLP